MLMTKFSHVTDTRRQANCQFGHHITAWTSQCATVQCQAKQTDSNVSRYNFLLLERNSSQIAYILAELEKGRHENNR